VQTLWCLHMTCTCGTYQQFEGLSRVVDNAPEVDRAFAARMVEAQGLGQKQLVGTALDVLGPGRQLRHRDIDRIKDLKGLTIDQ
jgi:hypothetical protein